MNDQKAASESHAYPREAQTIQTVVFAPLIQIDVDFAKRRVKVTQNGEPLSSASAAGAGSLVLEVRPACTPPPGRDPDGVGLVAPDDYGKSSSNSG